MTDKVLAFLGLEKVPGFQLFMLKHGAHKRQELYHVRLNTYTFEEGRQK
ncbi:MAG: hypothetical protein F6K39_09115, partial [Okeania sp. SIO3B3]|nr:hypothetical protein [Okeania sp. SIO3B3]